MPRPLPLHIATIDLTLAAEGAALAAEIAAAASVRCTRCGDTYPDADCAEGCEDFWCPLQGRNR